MFDANLYKAYSQMYAAQNSKRGAFLQGVMGTLETGVKLYSLYSQIQDRKDSRDMRREELSFRKEALGLQRDQLSDNRTFRENQLDESRRQFDINNADKIATQQYRANLSKSMAPLTSEQQLFWSQNIGESVPSDEGSFFKGVLAQGRYEGWLAFLKDFHIERQKRMDAMFRADVLNTAASWDAESDPARAAIIGQPMRDRSALQPEADMAVMSSFSVPDWFGNVVEHRVSDTEHEAIIDHALTEETYRGRRRRDPVTVIQVSEEQRAQSQQILDNFLAQQRKYQEDASLEVLKRLGFKENNNDARGYTDALRTIQHLASSRLPGHSVILGGKNRKSLTIEDPPNVRVTYVGNKQSTFIPGISEKELNNYTWLRQQDPGVLSKADRKERDRVQDLISASANAVEPYYLVEYRVPSSPHVRSVHMTATQFARGLALRLPMETERPANDWPNVYRPMTLHDGTKL